MRSKSLLLTLLLLAAFAGCRKHDFKDQVVGQLDQEQTDKTGDQKSADQFAKEEEEKKKAEEEENLSAQKAEEEKQAAEKKAAEEALAKQKAEEEEKGKKADGEKEDDKKPGPKNTDSPDVTKKVDAPPVAPNALDGYKEVLQAAVVDKEGNAEDGLIDYDQVLSHQDKLRLFIASAAGEETKSLSGAGVTSFLINLHNAVVLDTAATRKKEGKLVYAGQDKKGAWNYATGPVYAEFFKEKKVRASVISAEPVSLNDIRERIRKELAGLKLASAYEVTSLYVATSSSPLLASEPYSSDPGKLAEDLSANAKRYLNHVERGVEIDENKDGLFWTPNTAAFYPKILKWFIQAAFGGKEENLRAFLKEHVSDQRLVKDNFALKESSFDFSLDDVSSTSNE